MTRKIFVGGVAMGGGAPVSIQSMPNTKTTDVAGCLRQLHALKAAGCQIARLAVPHAAAAQSFAEIAAQSPLTSILITGWPSPPQKAAPRKFASIPETSEGQTGSRPWRTYAKAKKSPFESASTEAAWTKSSWKSTAIPPRRPWWKAPFPIWSCWNRQAFTTPACQSNPPRFPPW